MLFISHDLEVVRAICDRVTVMKEGRIAEDGPVHRINDEPATPYLRTLVGNV